MRRSFVGSIIRWTGLVVAFFAACGTDVDPHGLAQPEGQSGIDESASVKPEAPPRPAFAPDPGWELLEDCGTAPTLTSVSGLELVEFLKPGETCIDGETLVQRARGELRANLGQQHAKWLLVYQDEIPAEWREHALVFPGTVWRSPDGVRHVAYLYWDDGWWHRDFDWLDSGRWHCHGRLLRPGE